MDSRLFIRHLTQIESFCQVSSRHARRLKCEVNPSLPTSANFMDCLMFRKKGNYVNLTNKMRTF